MRIDMQQTSEAERAGFVKEIMQRDSEEANRKRRSTAARSNTWIWMKKVSSGRGPMACPAVAHDGRCSYKGGSFGNRRRLTFGIE